MLAADLKAKLDAKSLLDTFLGAVAGPASTLGSVAPPLSSSQVSAGANLSASVSTSGISGSISIVGGQTTGLLGGLPDPLQTLRPITAVLEIAESVTKDDPSAQIQAFLDRMTAMLSAPPHGSFLDLLAQAGAMVSSAPELKGIIDLLRTVFGAAQLDFDSFQILAVVPIAFAATIRAVSGLMGLIGGLVLAAEDALKTVGQTVTAALGDVEKAVDTAKGDLQKLFAAAHDFLGQLHLNQAAGEIAGNIHAFTDVLAKAQMKPYFDTATGAINTAADVISAVPLAMLPDSMKADLDAAVAPVRAINVEQVKDEIDGLLEIQGGKFELRAPLSRQLRKSSRITTR